MCVRAHQQNGGSTGEQDANGKKNVERPRRQRRENERADDGHLQGKSTLALHRLSWLTQPQISCSKTTPGITQAYSGLILGIKSGRLKIAASTRSRARARTSTTKDVNPPTAKLMMRSWERQKQKRMIA